MKVPQQLVLRVVPNNDEAYQSQNAISDAPLFLEGFARDPYELKIE